MLQKALDISDEILGTRLDVNFSDLEDYWHQIVLLHLVRSRQALAGIRFLAAKQFYSPAVVLCRHLFELGVNLRYMKNAPGSRVPIYQEHYRVPTSLEGGDEIRQKLRCFHEHEDHVEISKLLIPGTSWVTLKEMCEELGCLDHYLTIYRGASELAHGGAHGLGEEMLGLVEGQQLPEYKIAYVLLTAVTYHEWVVGVCCEVFPSMAKDFRLDPVWSEKCKELWDQVLEAIRAYVE